MYQHIVQYYETDMMGITHHSNYIRFMEEARIRYMDDKGLDYLKLEKSGIISPIIHIEFDYKKSTTFKDSIFISVRMEEFSGMKIVLYYEMYNQRKELIGTGKTISAFLDTQMRPVRLKKDYPQIYELIRGEMTE